MVFMDCFFVISDSLSLSHSACRHSASAAVSNAISSIAASNKSSSKSAPQQLVRRGSVVNGATTERVRADSFGNSVSAIRVA